jgi:hypothetical protein
VDRLAVQFGRELDTADQFEARFPGERLSFIKAAERIVIGNAEHPNAGAHSFGDQLGGRTSAVGFVSVRM